MQQDASQQSRRQYFENLVGLKYQLYNSLFLTLPLDAVEQTGLLLPLLEEDCQKGLDAGRDPAEILELFFAAHRPGLDEHKQAQFLFKVIQYVERQVVLIDALEDAAFAEIHQTEESNRLRKLVERVEADGLQEKFRQLLSEFSARIVLTAHPTQFYPGSVLGIITDLTAAIQANDIALARQLLQQLGNTPFFKKTKPTPSDEAGQLCWYLGNIFYQSIGEILDNLAPLMQAPGDASRQLLSIGFWPGGDRDGNPFVTSAITREVAATLRLRVLECYHRELRQLKRRLSFVQVQERLEAVEKQIHAELTNEVSFCFDSVDELLAELAAIGTILAERYQGLFQERLESFTRKVRAFGFHFASLDIRQDSRVLARVFDQLCQDRQLLPEGFQQMSEPEQLQVLLSTAPDEQQLEMADPLATDTLQSLQAMADIQRANGEAACHRYIISNCRSALDVARLMALFRLSGWQGPLTVDIVPLFESIDDLARAGDIMAQLYSQPAYRDYLAGRANRQTVMLGFSDGTKDGGYLMANWSIHKAKEALTQVSRQAGVEAVFFDGRGGPPARGGGSTYKFYAALGKRIESNQIQLTIQGQTISSYYGTDVAAKHNLRQLLAAGLENNLYERTRGELDDRQRQLLDDLADHSYQAYLALRQHRLFLPYLENMSTLNYYAESNIGSRPSRRGGRSELAFEDLRAIPFVGAWGQLKQNVPGYFGVGSALRAMEAAGRLDECRALYRDSGLFEALIGNSMQSMRKTDFRLTRHMENHPKYGEIWKIIHQEYELSREMVLKVSGQTVLLEDNLTSRYSIDLRQQVVLPLLVIQQYAMMRSNALSAAGGDEEMLSLYEKMIVRSLFGNINASRNSA